jgi:hypothetical protein
MSACSQLVYRARMNAMLAQRDKHNLSFVRN